MERELAPHGIGLVGALVLGYLAEMGPQVTTVLQERLKRNPNSVTNACDILERRELISCVRGKEDRRTVIRAITPAGLDLAYQLFVDD